MNGLIDTHTHLYLDDFDGEKEAAVNRAFSHGIDKMIFPNVDISTIKPMKELASKFPGKISMAMGLHPTEVDGNWEECLDDVLKEMSSYDRYIAVGEIGIDLYWDKSFEKEQMLVFDRQVSEAEKLNLPIIIHCREGLNQVLEVLEGHKGVQAVFHSFGGTIEDVNRIRSKGDYFFGINGIVTFKNCKVKETLSEITLTRLLLETDSPYLAPVPHRGKRNESSYLVDTAKFIAQYLGISYEELALRTSQNAKTLFSL